MNSSARTWVVHLAKRFLTKIRAIRSVACFMIWVLYSLHVKVRTWSNTFWHIFLVLCRKLWLNLIRNAVPLRRFRCKIYDKNVSESSGWWITDCVTKTGQIFCVLFEAFEVNSLPWTFCLYKGSNFHFVVNVWYPLYLNWTFPRHICLIERSHESFPPESSLSNNKHQKVITVARPITQGKSRVLQLPPKTHPTVISHKGSVHRRADSPQTKHKDFPPQYSNPGLLIHYNREEVC